MLNNNIIFQVSQQNITKDLEYHIHGCLQRYTIPVQNSRIACDPQRGTEIKLSYSDQSDTLQYFYPYPEVGNWFFHFEVVCNPHDNEG